MPTPPLASTDDHVHPDVLVADVGSFVPKSEDMGVSFHAFNSTSQDKLTSSAAHSPGAAIAFEARPGSSHTAPSVSLTQLDMDVLDSIASGDPSGAFMNGFAASHQQIQMQSSGNDDMQGVTPVREQSPGSVHTPSSNPSHAASPVPPPFSNVSTSSLASALEEPNASLLNRSRSGSLASPGATANFGSRPSPSQSTQEASFKFTLPSEVTGIPRPDPVNAPHMLVVDDVLNSIMRAAASARQACSMGKSFEASSKIDEMRQKVALVAELLSNTGIDSPPKQDSPRGGMSGGPSASSNTQGHRHSMSLPRLTNNPSTPPGFIPNFPNSGVLSIPSGPSSLEQAVGGPLSMDLTSVTGNQGSPDSDTSRKRCASSMGGNRVNKVIRLDPSDGSLPPLTQSASPPKINLDLPVLQGQSLSTSQAQSVMPSPVATLSGNAQIPLSHTASSGSLSSSLTTVNPMSTGSIVPGAPAIVNMSTSRPIPSSAPVTGVRPGLLQSQTSFPLPLTASAPVSLTDTGRREIDAQLGVEMASPTNTTSGWADLSSTTPVQSQLGSGIGTVRPHDLAGASAMPFSGQQFTAAGHAPPIPMQTAPAPLGQSSGLGSRSGSFSHPNPHQSMYGTMAGNGSVTSVDQVQQPQPLQQHAPPEFVPSQGGRSRAHSRATAPAPRSPSSSSCEEDGESDYEGSYGTSYGQYTSKSSPPLRSRPGSPHRRPSAAGSSASPADSQPLSSGASSGNEIPPEYRADVDRVFFEFLNKVCSNLDATDAKGELIHQTLMAKKMQRLDESPDFRPFKFRIQAFTNGFLEELARQGFPEEKIAMKKVRNYLWTQPYISRFNEDGKKAKSKGNHIWNIDAKKKAEGGWEFRPFRRKLAGAPPSVAYIGLRWSWMPRIWDPQASRANIQVQYSSPNLPPWLSWRDGQLQGIPPPDAQSCEVTVEARTMQDGKEELLTQTFLISVSPVPTGTDMSFSGVRPSLAVDLHNPRRVNSDSIVPNVAGTVGRPIQAMPPPPLGQPAALTAQDAQMMQVLTSAAQRVAQEAQAHVIASARPHEPPGPELQALAKQQHVLTVTAQALDQEVSVHPEAVPPSSHALVAAAQQVVFQAARQVAADRTAVMSLATGVPPSQQAPGAAPVTVNEVSVATQTAVAHAVEITGPLSSEVDVMMTASSILQQHTRTQQMMTPVEQTPLAQPSLDGMRPHSTGTVPTQFSLTQSAIPPYTATAAPLSSLGPF
ncbi:uncharacterized protein FOMMEDRAFT_21137 [Fomitiporia mediterranea MF3/22]|uniref:uncharacterized protein n=1 Tax=Fomitiporia mediterranea (strain MF3/22) TaxID=694068 RepID=UPI0004407616|nr:uncharacterized protein FOMMEDRAFT_21137 [Fomitiporia mediterranea MF3/22]EJD02419.1 hypothetical protein FOMMEDRAFT_21137 [Fomitiporia mediterranea MF3/22]